MDADFEKFASFSERLKVLAHPVRLCIINRLLESGSSNVGSIQDCLDLPQSTISQHLQKLKSAGIVSAKRYGLEMHYFIADPVTAKWLNQLINPLNIKLTQEERKS